MLAGYNESEALLDWVYLISIVVTILTFLFIAIFRNGTAPYLDHVSLRYIVPCGIALSTVLIGLGAFGGIGGLICIWVAGILSGGFSALFHMQLFQEFFLMPLRSIIMGAAIGTIIASLLFALFLFFSQLASVVFATLMPLLAALFLACKRRFYPAEETEIDKEPLADIPSSLSDQRYEWRHLTIMLALSGILVGLANESARTLYIQMEIIDAGGTMYGISEIFAAVVTIIGAVLIVCFMLIRQSDVVIQGCFYLLIVALLLSVLALPIPFIYPAVSPSVFFVLNSAAYSCFGLFFWTLTITLCQRYENRRIRAFAFIRAAWACGPLLGLTIGRIVLRLLGMRLETAFPVMLIGVICLVMVIGVIVRGSDLRKVLNIASDKYQRRFQEKCRKTIEKYGLSEREGEVMILLAKGRNLPYIQEHLHLSKSTVSTHRQHIHQKLGVHTQQELIDTIESNDL